jgi:threonine dehydrogenase-like Zn-dependent dehydrogenase
VQRLEEVRALTHGEGVDVVIEAAGSARAVEEGLTLVRITKALVDPWAA